MKKLFFAMFISFSAVSNAQQDSSYKLPKYVHKLGAHAGTTSGLGLSYKLLANNKWMFQLVTLPIASKDFKYVNSGISVKYKFKDYDLLDFYAFGAASYAFSQYSYYESSFYPPYDTYQRSEIYDNWNCSGGIAIEIGKGELAKWGIQMGYGLYSIGTEDWLTNLSIGTTLDFSLNSK